MIMENIGSLGTVQWFSRVKGYGFIRPDGQEEDVFVHYSVINGEGYRNLSKGQRVEFMMEDTSKGPQAVNVTGLDTIVEVESVETESEVESVEAESVETESEVESVEVESVETESEVESVETESEVESVETESEVESVETESVEAEN